MKIISRGLNTEHTEESATKKNLAKTIEDIAVKWNIFGKGKGQRGSPDRINLKPTEILKYILYYSRRCRY
jgi:hypothetical protein